MDFKQVKVLHRDFPTYDRIVSGDPARGLRPKEVSMNEMQPGQFAVRYKLFQTGLSWGDVGKHLVNQPAEICRILETLDEARPHSQQITEQHGTVVCPIYDLAANRVPLLPSPGSPFPSQASWLRAIFANLGLFASRPNKRLRNFLLAPLVLATSTLAIASSLATAQENGSEPPPQKAPVTLKMEVNEVPIPVTVTNAKTHAVVRGLRPENFEISVDGGFPRPVIYLRDPTQPAILEKSAHLKEPPGYYSNAPSAPSLQAPWVVLWFDGLNTSQDKLNAPRQWAKESLQHFPQGTEVMVVVLNRAGGRAVQGWTRDMNLAQTAIDHITALDSLDDPDPLDSPDVRMAREMVDSMPPPPPVGGSSPPPNLGELNVAAEINAKESEYRAHMNERVATSRLFAQRLAAYLGALKQSQHVVIRVFWISSFYPETYLLGRTPADANMPSGFSAHTETVDNSRANVDIVKALTDNEIPLTTVRAEGLATPGIYDASEKGSFLKGGKGPNVNDMNARMQRENDNRTWREYTMQIGRDTGGGECLGNGADCLVDAVRNLPYEAVIAARERDGKLHHIKVRVIGNDGKPLKGVAIEYRTIFYAKSAEPATEPPKDGGEKNKKKRNKKRDKNKEESSPTPAQVLRVALEDSPFETYDLPLHAEPQYPPAQFRSTVEQIATRVVVSHRDLPLTDLKGDLPNRTGAFQMSVVVEQFDDQIDREHPSGHSMASVFPIPSLRVNEKLFEAQDVGMEIVFLNQDLYRKVVGKIKHPDQTDASLSNGDALLLDQELRAQLVQEGVLQKFLSEQIVCLVPRQENVKRARAAVINERNHLFGTLNLVVNPPPEAMPQSPSPPERTVEPSHPNSSFAVLLMNALAADPVGTQTQVVAWDPTRPRPSLPGRNTSQPLALSRGPACFSTWCREAPDPS